MSGLGKSTPLVTISGPAAIKRGIAVPAGDNHPLAASPQSETGSGNEAQQTTSQGAPTPIKAPSTNTVARSPAAGAAASSMQPKVSSASVSPSKSLDTLADNFLSGSSYRTEQLGLAPLLRPTPLPHEDGIHRLRTLVERRAWGDVLKISTTMLNSPNDLHSAVYSSLVTLPLNAPQVDASAIPPQIREETEEIMALQCHAWLKLRRYADLVAEVERWNFLTFNDATAQSPEWLSWNLHILAGQAQQYAEHVDRPSDILFELRDRIPKEDALWLMNVDNALANMFLRTGEWRLALGSLDRMVELIPEATRHEVWTKHADASNPEELERVLCCVYKCEVLSRQGRVLLQVGALPQVAQIFKRANAMWDTVSSNIPAEIENLNAVKLAPCQIEMNAGLYAFSKSEYDQALQSYSLAVEMLRKFGDLSSKYHIDEWRGLTIAGSYDPNFVYSECVNNMSLCCLYTCEMHNAVEYLEGLVREDPTAFLNERVAFNLCTLYELGSDSASSARKKRVLQLIAKRFFLHDVGPESFRVT